MKKDSIQVSYPAYSLIKIDIGWVLGIWSGLWYVLEGLFLFPNFVLYNIFVIQPQHNDLGSIFLFSGFISLFWPVIFSLIFLIFGTTLDPSISNIITVISIIITGLISGFITLYLIIRRKQERGRN